MKIKLYLIFIIVVVFTLFKIKPDKEQKLQFPNIKLSIKEQILQNKKLLKFLEEEQVLENIKKLFSHLDLLKTEKDFNISNNIIIRIEAINWKIENKKIVEKLKRKKMYYEASLMNSLIQNTKNIITLHYSLKDLKKKINY